MAMIAHQRADSQQTSASATWSPDPSSVRPSERRAQQLGASDTTADNPEVESKATQSQGRGRDPVSPSPEASPPRRQRSNLVVKVTTGPSLTESLSPLIVEGLDDRKLILTSKSDEEVTRTRFPFAFETAGYT
ncbi:unnamed protein product [Arctogadus glacialis]